MSLGTNTIWAARGRRRCRTTTALAVIALASGLLAGSPAHAASLGDTDSGVRAETQTVSRISGATFEKRLLRQINQRRAARDLPRVRRIDGCLDRLAEAWATHIATTGLLVHRDQNVVITACDLTWAGETLARGTGLTPRSTVKAWMKSPSHKAVIMKKRANRAGIGIDQDAEGRTVVVLNFGDVN